MKSQRFQWWRNYWKGANFRYFTYAVIVLPPAFTAWISFIDGKFNPVALVFWAGYVFVFIPIAYLMRNNA